MYHMRPNFDVSKIPNQTKSLEHFYGRFHRPLGMLIHHYSSTLSCSSEVTLISLYHFQHSSLFISTIFTIFFFLIFQDTSVIGPITPLLCFLVPAIYIAHNSEEFIYELNPILYIFVFGIVGSKITNKLIVSLSKLKSFK